VKLTAVHLNIAWMQIGIDYKRLKSGSELFSFQYGAESVQPYLLKHLIRFPGFMSNH